MRFRLLVVNILAVSSLLAASKQPVAGRAGNELVDLSASLLLDREAIKQALGSDLGGNFVVVEVRLAPKPGKQIPVHRDDFLLRTDRDGEKATPYAPSQIAGRGALVISQTGGRGGIFGESMGPVWGGYPGSGQRPERLGSDGGVIGNAGETSNQTAVQSGKAKENPLLKVLKEKVLPEKDTGAPVSGYLYFPMEAKQKAKDLELFYTTAAGKISLRFH